MGDSLIADFERATQPVVGDFNGPGWPLAPLADPTGATKNGKLYGVACPHPATCFGVGFDQISIPVALNHAVERLGMVSDERPGDHGRPRGRYSAR